MTSLLFRDRSAAHSGRVSFIELFFDLVFVFAITQLSHSLLAHFTPRGALETVLLLLAVWWVWIYTSWVTNWMNPESGPVRVMLFVLMLVGLGLTTSLPQAFSSPVHGLIFAGCYVAMQVGRSLFMAISVRGHSYENHLNFIRISVWFATSGIFWIWGAFSSGDLRLGLWAVALLIEYIGPRAFYWIPVIGKSSFASWDVDGEHLAERCGLFVIIALGESILVMGASFAHEALSLDTTLAFLQSFVTCIAMWWLYFGLTASKASHKIAHAELPGELAQVAYTYIHLLLVAGIILTAVGDEHVLMHPHEEAGIVNIASILGGPALYLLGNLLFIRVTASKWAPLHLLGIVALAGVGAGAFYCALPLNALGLAFVSAAVLVVVSLVEPWLYRRLSAKA
ncbi:low temperature requirement protein A [Asticcacaulis sp. BYS171W]|uniref:Low temperature requirement protein A n=1 Tax=Asticcacaulis aquaticus TaxID=2984212 RepID=A0ABT5HPF7_9CAUL|nr:low temperature requirement protein A [Asticcacaulis aquaticus]MDC7681947.1 low temperature requirement protein A [Asticcacaulis aquaticus]